MKRKKLLFLTLMLVLATLLSAQAPNAFITIWEPTGTEIRFPGVGTNYTILVRDLSTNNVVQTITDATSPTVESTWVDITGLTANTRYALEVVPGEGEFISFRTRGNAGRDKLFLKEVKQWGTIPWRSDMAYAFQQARNMELTATDKPDLSSVTVLTGFFNDASSMVGNPSITTWETGNVTSMASMFSGANAFNQPLDWNVGKVTNMTGMFAMANAFNQNVGNWNYHVNVNLRNMLNNSGLNIENYDATLKGWDENTTFTSGKEVGVYLLKYSPTGKTYRDNLLAKGWSFLLSTGVDGDIYDSGETAQDPNAFITIWEPTGTEIRYPGVGTNYTIVVRDLTTNNVVQTITDANSPTVESTWVDITGLTANTRYALEVVSGDGEFTSFRTRGNAGRDKLFLKEVKQWGTIPWRADMAYAFQQARNMELTATDKPDLSSVTVLTGFFNDASSMVGNPSITTWETGNVTSMASMFSGANAFNQPLNWNVEKVTNMTNMFSMANAFNQNVGNWNYHVNVNLENMLNTSGLSIENYDATLKGWDENTTFTSGKTVGTYLLKYSSVGKTYRDNLVEKGWSFLLSNGADGDIYDPDYIYSSVSQVIEDKLNIQINNNIILVGNITNSGLVHLFDISGKLVSSKREQGNKVEFQVNNPGFYIISTQNQRSKVVVR